MRRFQFHLRNFKEIYGRLAVFETDFGRFSVLSDSPAVAMPFVSSAYLLYVINSIGIAASPCRPEYPDRFTGRFPWARGILRVAPMPRILATSQASRSFWLFLRGVITALVGSSSAFRRSRRGLYLTIATSRPVHPIHPHSLEGLKQGTMGITLRPRAFSAGN